MKQSEIELLQGLRRNDRAAITEMYDRHQDNIVQYIVDNNGTVEDGQDVFQDALAILIETIRAGSTSMENVHGYLFRICQNRWRRKLRNRKFSLPITEEIHPGQEEEEQELMEQLLLYKRIEGIRKIILKLDRKCQELIEKWYWEKIPQKEIAQEYRQEHGVIRVYLNRCRTKLRLLCKQDPNFAIYY